MYDTSEWCCDVGFTPGSSTSLPTWHLVTAVHERLSIVSPNYWFFQWAKSNKSPKFQWLGTTGIRTQNNVGEIPIWTYLRQCGGPRPSINHELKTLACDNFYIVQRFHFRWSEGSMDFQDCNHSKTPQRESKRRWKLVLRQESKRNLSSTSQSTLKTI